jgi:uncharacterized protein
MHDWVEKLLKVQEKDLRIGKLRQQIEAVPVEKKKIQASLEDAKASLNAVKARVTDEEKRIKTLEMEVDSLRAKQRDFESKSAMIKDNDEYRKALHQIEMCRHKISGFEEEELTIMADLENAKTSFAEEKKAFASNEKRVEQMKLDLDTRAKNCQAQLEKLEVEREKLTAGIPAANLNRYNRIRKSRPMTQSVLVPVGNSNICGGCHMNIPAQDRVNAARGSSATCPNCACLLYYVEE